MYGLSASLISRHHSLPCLLQMVAIDVLTVPVTQSGNRYLLIAQGYFTKWADAIPMADHSASTITTALIKLFFHNGDASCYPF